MIASNNKMSAVEVNGFKGFSERARKSRLLWIIGSCILPSLFFLAAEWAVLVMAFDVLKDSSLTFAFIVGCWTLLVFGMAGGALPKNLRAAFNKEEPVDNMAFFWWTAAAALLVVLHFSAIVVVGKDKTTAFEQNFPYKVFTSTMKILSGPAYENYVTKMKVKTLDRKLDPLSKDGK